MKRAILSALLLIAVLFVAACAPTMNDQVHTGNGAGYVAGFWRGLWHGIIAPITFIISLFTDKVGMYEAHNSGGWYNFGFLLGIGAFHGGHYARRRRRRELPRGAKVEVTYTPA